MNKIRSFWGRAAQFIVRRRIVFALLFAAMLVFSVFSIRWVKVENEVTAFLPEDAEARVGLEIMEEEFATYGSAKIMVKGLSLDEAERLQKEIAAQPDVLLVQFDESEQHYNGKYALYDVTFSDVVKSERSEKALAGLLDYLKDYDVTYYSEVGFSMAGMLTEQMGIVMIFVVLVVLAVLVFTSSTYAEIPVMLLTFLAATVINLGTAFLMGTISFVSSSVAVVMQLSLSVDYAIILCNRYKEERQSRGVQEATENALAASIPEIFASSLTTIAGLTAMTFMQFRLGMDLGLNLIKAIVISMLTVFTFMPALLVFFGPAMEKTKHRSFVPRVSFIGRFAYKTRVVIPILLVLLVTGAYLLNNRINYAFDQDLMPYIRQTPRYTSFLKIQEQFGRNNLVAVLVPTGDYEAEKALLEELEAGEGVKSVTGLSNIEAVDGYTLGDKVNAKAFAEIAGVDDTTARALLAYYAAGNGAHQTALKNLDSYEVPLIDLFLFLHDAVENGEIELESGQAANVSALFDSLQMIRGQLVGKAHSRIVVNLSLPPQSDETFAFLDSIHSMTARYYGTPAVLTGDSVSALDFRDSFVLDNVTVSVLSIVMVMVILFFTFRSVAMPLLLILIIQGSIWINFAIPVLRGKYVFFVCYLIVGAIQMGANIDYAIVVSTRYREARVAFGRKGAIIRTMNLAFPTIITSGLMLTFTGLMIGFGVSQCIIAGIGFYMGIGTSISLALTLFALPQVLVLADRFVVSDSMESRQRRHSAAFNYLEGKRRGLTAGALALALVLALVAVPFGVIGAKNHNEDTQRYTEEKLAETAELRTLAQQVELAKAYQSALAYGFAEQYMTDQIGSEQLMEGYAEYAEGLEAYNEGKAQYDEGAAQLADAESAYNAGKAKLAAGQAEYDAGVAQYNEGKAQRDAAAQQLAEGQAQYDEGMAQYQAAQAKLAAGQAEYDAGLAQYNTAKASLDSVTPLYQSALAARDRVNGLQAQYDEAVASGDTVRALALSGMLTGARAAAEYTNFDSLLAQYQSAQAELAAAEAQLNEGKAQLDAGYAELAAAEAQLNEGKAQLDSGYAQLADADAQLANAEAQLNAGKAQLDAGQAQLNAGGAEINAGREQLADAEAQLKEGEEALNEAAAQLIEGMATLAQNREELNASIKALDALNENEAKLDAGLEALRAEPGLSSALRRNAGALDTIEAAEAWLRDAAEKAERQEKTATVLAALLALAALTALAALLLSMKWLRLPALLCGLASLLAAVSCVLLRSRCADLSPWMPLAAALLTVASAVFMTVLLSDKRTTTA